MSKKARDFQKFHDFNQTSPSLEMHPMPITAIDAIMIATGKNYQVLTDLWDMLSDKHRLELEVHVRQFIYGQTLNCFDLTCRNRKPKKPEYLYADSKWSEVKLWAINVLKALRVSLPVPVGKADRQLVLVYCTYIDIPDIIDAFREIGADPIFADENTKCILHYAVFRSQTTVLKHALQLFKENNISVDSKDELGQTAYFSYIARYCDNEMNEDEEFDFEKFNSAPGDFNEHVLTDLLNAGADPLATDLENHTCLHYAVTQGNLVSVQHLREYLT